MRLTSYRVKPVALMLHGDLALLAPELERLGPDDALNRVTAAMRRLAMELELGLANGPYEERAGLSHYVTH